MAISSCQRYVQREDLRGCCCFHPFKSSYTNLNPPSTIVDQVITGVAHNSRCAQEEIFGPVCTVHAFDTEEEAVTLANDVEYGLASSVWTLNGPRGLRVAQQIHTGMVWVNCWMHRDLRVPFGGVKQSGMGHEGGTLR